MSRQADAWTGYVGDKHLMLHLSLKGSITVQYGTVLTSPEEGIKDPGTEAAGADN